MTVPSGLIGQADVPGDISLEWLLLTATNLTPPMLAGILPAHGRELGELMADYNRIVTAGPLVEDRVTA